MLLNSGDAAMKSILCLGLATSVLVCSCDGSARLSKPRPPGQGGVGPRAAVVVSTAGGITRMDLGTLGGVSSYATDINESGTVVGWSQTAAGWPHAFRWTASTGMVDLGTLP